MAGNDLGTRIRRARERKRWSQEQLAAALGVGARSIGRWERGEAEPRSSIGALEAVLGTDLTSGEEPDPAELRIRELGAQLGLTDADLDEWVRMYRQRRAGDGLRERAS